MTLAVWAWCLSAGVASAAPKIDLVVLVNGDRLTCEIKSLSRGRLSIGTDALETVSVYWDQVERVASPQVFEVETGDGLRYVGSLAEEAPRRLRVVTPGQPDVSLSMDDIVRMTPIEAGFWRRLDGNIDFGFSFAKANRETRWSLNAEADYRARSYLVNMALASQLTARDDADKLARQNLTLSGSRLYPRRWFSFTLGQVQQNEELALDLRTVVGGGVGRFVVQSNAATVRLISGVVYTRERFASDEPQNSAEVAVGADWNWFSAHDNDLDLSTSVLSFYNVSGDARARVEARAALRVEFLSDFYFSINGYESFDSSPPESRTNNDFGFNLALGWKF